jgi:hypothetical protein
MHKYASETIVFQFDFIILHFKSLTQKWRKLNQSILENETPNGV